MCPAVTKTCGTFVRPHGTTPSGRLNLSFIDKLPWNNEVFDLLLVYKHGGRDSAKVIRDALSRAMTYYYPLAGKLVPSSDRTDLEVECTGDGSLFVEAFTDCTLDDVNHFDYPLMLSPEDLFPYESPPTVDPHSSAATILRIQVTEFTCGGFTVGCLLQHALFDGVGMGQFLKAVGEFARDPHYHLAVEPVWCRDIFPVQPQHSSPSAFVMTLLDLEYMTLEIPVAHINELRTKFIEETGNRCSTFDIISAIVWQCRTRALDLAPHVRVHFSITVNVRPLLSHLLPSQGAGYYGNCIFNALTTVPSGKIASGSIFEIIDLIRDAKERAASYFWKWSRGEWEQWEEVEGSPLYHVLVASDIRMVGFSQVDFGWGEPIQCAPLTRNDNLPSFLIVKSRDPMSTVKLTTRAVKMEHLPAFRDQLMSFNS